MRHRNPYAETLGGPDGGQVENQAWMVGAGWGGVSPLSSGHLLPCRNVDQVGPDLPSFQEVLDIQIFI